MKKVLNEMIIKIGDVELVSSNGFVDPNQQSDEGRELLQQLADLKSGSGMSDNDIIEIGLPDNVSQDEFETQEPVSDTVIPPELANREDSLDPLKSGTEEEETEEEETEEEETEEEETEEEETEEEETEEEETEEEGKDEESDNEEETEEEDANPFAKKTLKFNCNEDIRRIANTIEE